MSPREFEILARSLAPRLRSEALRIVSDGMDADDIVQDTMLKLWDMRERLDNIASIDAFAVVITLTG